MAPIARTSPPFEQQIHAFRHIHHAGRTHDVAQLLDLFSIGRGIGRAGQIACAGGDCSHTDDGGGARHGQIVCAFCYLDRAFDCGDGPGDFQNLTGLR